MLFQEHVMKQCNKIIKNEIILMQVSPLMRRDFALYNNDYTFVHLL